MLKLTRCVMVVSALCFAALLGCGKERPRAHLAPGQVAQVTAASFESLTSQGKPVLLDFWAPWCPPCRLQGPHLDQAAARIGDRGLVGKVNVDEEKDLARRFQVQAIPTLILFKNGRETQRFTGLQQAETLVKALEE